jgi:hypothetical protein
MVAVMLKDTSRSSWLRFVLKTVVWALIIEAISLPPAVLTLGHAGPEGRFAELGYLGLLINLVGFAVVGRFRFDSMLSFSVWVVIVQVCFITGVTLTFRWLVLRGRK